MSALSIFDDEIELRLALHEEEQILQNLRNIVNNKYQNIYLNYSIPKPEREEFYDKISDFGMRIFHYWSQYNNTSPDEKFNMLSDLIVEANNLIHFGNIILNTERSYLRKIAKKTKKFFSRSRRS